MRGPAIREPRTDRRAAGTRARHLALSLCTLAGLAVPLVVASPAPRAGAATSCTAKVGRPSTSVKGAYNRAVLSLRPVLYLPLANESSLQSDLSGHGQNGHYNGSQRVPVAALPNGDGAAGFDGQSNYVEVASNSSLSVPTTGCLTIEAWVRPMTLEFPEVQGSGYVYILGKGIQGKQEYALRMYSRTNAEDPPRPNRVSAYIYNLSGGEGSGAYFQDPVTVGRWFMVTFVVDQRSSNAWPAGSISIYKNGRFRDQVSIEQFPVTPAASDAPFRIGSRDLESFFYGDIAKVAVYDSALTKRQILSTYRTMFVRPPPVRRATTTTHP